MSAKIINANRYKKTTRKDAEKKKKLIKYKYNNNLRDSNNIPKLKKSKINKKQKSTIKINKKNNVTLSDFSFFKLLKITGLVGCLILIGFLSRKVVNFENFSLNVFSNKDENNSLEKGYYFNIAVSNIDTMDMYTTKNIILNEIINSTKLKLIDINEDYTLKYMVAEKIEKIDDLNYNITLNKDYGVDTQNVIDTINKIKELGTQNSYYNSVENIEQVSSSESNKLNIKLREANPYFPYKLNFPLYIDNDKSKTKTEYEISDKSSTTFTMVKNKSESTLDSVKLTNYIDTDEMIKDFRDSKFDVFIASSDSLMQQIGKHEYSVKKYRDGQTIFLFGNKNSKLFSQKEVRQAIAYSLNRDEIVKKVNPSFSEVIDIPYIYSKVQYKYDIYGAQNALLSNGWKKSSDIYIKTIDNQSIKLELNILVNKNDSIKMQIAQIIKDMLEPKGIGVNIVSLNQNEVIDRVNSGEYDLVLADVYINDSPDINMLYNYLNINDNINSKIERIKSSNVIDLEKSIQDLQTTISNEIACIGIMAKNTNIVYQKNIVGFDNTNYMKLFNNFINIGKLK